MKYNMNFYNTVIIGAGPAGLIAGISSALLGRKTIILEKNHSPGIKLLATGNGQANITNLIVRKKNYHSETPEKVIKIYNQFNNLSLIKFFQTNGMEILIKENKVFPATLSSKTVLRSLLLRLRESECKLSCRKKVVNISIDKVKKNFRLSTEGKDNYICKKLIIATGKLASPQFGSTGIGLKWAKKFGHRIIESFPVLVPLILKPHPFHKLQGVKIKANIKILDNKKEYIFSNDDLLFTKYGLSGKIIFKSSYITGKLLKKKDIFMKNNKLPIIEIDMLPNIENLANRLLNLKKNFPNRSIAEILSGFVHPKIVDYIAEKLNFHKLDYDEDTYIKNNILTKILSNKIEKELKHARATIIGHKDYKYAQAATGGVSLNNIKINMESKLVPNLYFAGEILDATGDSGGYNLQFAFSSGFIAGKN